MDSATFDVFPFTPGVPDDLDCGPQHVEITTEGSLHTVGCEVPPRPQAYYPPRYVQSGYKYLLGFMTTIGDPLDDPLYRFD